MHKIENVSLMHKDLLKSITLIKKKQSLPSDSLIKPRVKKINIFCMLVVQIIAIKKSSGQMSLE